MAEEAEIKPRKGGVGSSKEKGREEMGDL